jgi:hypothetical protein
MIHDVHLFYFVCLHRRSEIDFKLKVLDSLKYSRSHIQLVLLLNCYGHAFISRCQTREMDVTKMETLIAESW